MEILELPQDRFQKQRSKQVNSSAFVFNHVRSPHFFFAKFAKKSNFDDLILIYLNIGFKSKKEFFEAIVFWFLEKPEELEKENITRYLFSWCFISKKVFRLILSCNPKIFVTVFLKYVKNTLKFTKMTEMIYNFHF